MPRLPRIVLPNFPHHVTQRGTNKGRIYFTDMDREYFLKCLKESAERTLTQIWAYCLMDNHFHLILVPEQRESLGGCLHRTTFRYAQYFNRKYERIGRLWQNRYFSCPVEKDEYLWAVIRYVEKNPVRALMVARAEDWKWSSARAHIHGEPDVLMSQMSWFDESRRSEYHRMIHDDNNQEEAIRMATTKGKPFGGETFIEHIEEIEGIFLKPKKVGRPKR